MVGPAAVPGQAFRASGSSPGGCYAWLVRNGGRSSESVTQPVTREGDDPATRDRAVFDSLEPDARDEVEVPNMLGRLLETGLRRDDSRLQEVFRALEDNDGRALGFD